MPGAQRGGSYAETGTPPGKNSADGTGADGSGVRTHRRKEGFAVLQLKSAVSTRRQKPLEGKNTNAEQR